MILNYKHTPVLADEAISSLNIRPDGIYIDGTFGLGGHSRMILSRLGARGRLLVIDRDPKAIAVARTIKDSRLFIIHGPFSSISNYVGQYKLKGKINGILFDLGLSSMQISDVERGFSFMHNGRLDMRMDPTCGQSAAEWLKESKEVDIAWVIKTFGEERFYKRIARAIVKYNRDHPMTSTKELVEVVMTAIPTKYKFKHPATRTFQAIRIVINDELREIDLALNDSLNVLAPSGRLSIISFHSLEDRIVKHFIHEKSRGLQIPLGLPITEKQILKINSHRQLIKLGKLMPSKEEVEKNPRARSAILRFAERINL